MVFTLVYSSTTDHDWSSDELLALLTYSRDWNDDHGITGLLLYRDCVFMQLLEGEEGEIRYLFSHIVTDRRHQDVDLLWTDEADARRFGDWSMAFRELREHPILEPGYRGEVDVAIDKDSPERPNELDDFLSMFKPT